MAEGVNERFCHLLPQDCLFPELGALVAWLLRAHSQRLCFAFTVLKFQGRELIGPAEVTCSVELGWGFLTGKFHRGFVW